MKTYSQKASEINREWWLIDAGTMPLGKLAVVIADKLMGKSKVTYTPHIDNGDYVVVINAKNIVVTGNKMVDKKYYRHSGYPGGLKELKLEEVLEKNPARAVIQAVGGMERRLRRAYSELCTPRSARRADEDLLGAGMG